MGLHLLIDTIGDAYFCEDHSWDDFGTILAGFIKVSNGISPFTGCLFMRKTNNEGYSKKPR